MFEGCDTIPNEVEMKAYQMAAHDEDDEVNDAEYVYDDFRVHGYILLIVLQSKILNLLHLLKNYVVPLYHSQSCISRSHPLQCKKLCKARILLSM